jgi:hypothetical protein
MKNNSVFKRSYLLISSLSPYPLFKTVASLGGLLSRRSRTAVGFIAALAGMLVVPSIAPACPFCTAVKPSLSQQCDVAAIVAFAECLEATDSRQSFRLLKAPKGGELLKSKTSLELTRTSLADPVSTPTIETGSLALLLAKRDELSAERELRWTEIPLNETSYAYVARAPSLRKPAAKRLAYFIPYLEHRDPLLAEDAYLEFGHARYDEVAAVADKLPMDAMRRWLEDDRVPQARKGFYGLALGLSRNEPERWRNAEFLKQQILKPASDFRAGFDGTLGGYLMAAGEPALELIEKKYLADPRAASGDVRHAMTALRFYHEYGREIPAERLAQALRKLLVRQEFAAAAIVDLARWQDWESSEAVIALCQGESLKDASIRRSAISYLLLCPTEQAARETARLRQLYPKEAADAEKRLNLNESGK